jgi:hypothetical protein
MLGFGKVGREREIEKMQGEKILLPLFVRIQGKKKKHYVVPNDTVLCFFLLNNT